MERSVIPESDGILLNASIRSGDCAAFHLSLYPTNIHIIFCHNSHLFYQQITQINTDYFKNNFFNEKMNFFE